MVVFNFWKRGVGVVYFNLRIICGRCYFFLVNNIFMIFLIVFLFFIVKKRLVFNISYLKFLFESIIFIVLENDIVSVIFLNESFK